jgi:DNA polymerase
VGEAPGREEDLKAEPFVGRSGQLLTKMIEAMGLKREGVYICNVVKCRPPENRDPEPDEVAMCEPFLKTQLEILKPEVIVALGRHACQSLLGTVDPMSKFRGEWSKYEGIDLMPTYHPAYLLRNPPKKKEVWEDLQKVMKRLGI